MVLKFSIGFLLLSYALLAFATQDKTAVIQYDSDGFEIISSAPSDSTLREINEAYKTQVKPIFDKKCLMCHGQAESKPWYYWLPGVRQLIDRDVSQAKQEMDMSRDFPFAAHGYPVDDLRSIERELENEDMPPIQYRLVHWNSLLTKEELKLVKRWIESSRIKLNAN